jgi:xylan 1,4-beta-xylosidase
MRGILLVPGAVLWLSLALGARAAAQTPPTVNVTVDATAPGAAIEKVWPFHGYDEVNYTTTAPGRALLSQLATLQPAPTHVRTHFLLNTGDGTAALKWGSTNVYTEDAAGNPVYSWTLMDGIMDAITGAGAFPLAEIAFMPQAMTTAPVGTAYRNTGIYTLDGGCFYPPKDYSKWGTLIRAWATHVAGRYPGAESSWQWELWNEPDIDYWKGTVADYSRLYDYTEAALHQVLPNASLGGPAVANAGSAFFTQFLQHCATGTNAVSGSPGARLDMISFHAKGEVAITGGHVEMDLGNQLRLHRTGFTTVAGFPAFKQTPIVITEADPDGCAACPASQTPADAYRNSPAYGAYEVAMMKRTLELEARLGVKVRGLLTWAFLFPGTPYFPGYRALETNGIDLPVLNAFKLLGSLDGARLTVTSSGARTLDDILANSVRQQADVDAMATLNGPQVRVLVWNYHDDIVAVAASPVHLSVQVPAAFGARVVVSNLRADDTHGDAYTLWVAQGSPAAPSAAQITALQQGMEPTLLEPARTVDVVAGVVALDFDLPRHGISLVTLASAAVAAADASVTDGALGDGAVAAPDSGRAGTGGVAGTGAGGAVGGAAGGSNGGTTTGGGGASGSGGSVGATGAGGGASPATPGTHGGGGCACALTRLPRTPVAPLLAMIFVIALVIVRRRR